MRPTTPLPTAELLAVVREYMEAGRLDAATRLLGHVLSAHRAHGAALHLCATIAQRRGRPDEAVILLRAAAAAGGGTAAILRDLAELLRVGGAPAEALAAAAGGYAVVSHRSRVPLPDFRRPGSE